MSFYSPLTSTPQSYRPGSRLIVALSGLPARGKSYVACRTIAYLRWIGVRAQVFNVGKRRRAAQTEEAHDANFFDANNASAASQREALAMGTMDDCIEFVLGTAPSVAVLDATNTTRARRAALHARLAANTAAVAAGVQLVFVECICTDLGVLASNMLQKVTHSPDYRDMPVDVALADLQARIAAYERVYQPLDDMHEPRASYIQLQDLQSKVVAKNLHGSLTFKMLAYMMALHIEARPIFLMRAGHCQHAQDVLGTVLAQARASSAGAKAVVEPLAVSDVRRAPSSGGLAPSTAQAYCGVGSDGWRMACALRLSSTGEAWARDVGAYLRAVAATAHGKSLDACAEAVGRLVEIDTSETYEGACEGEASGSDSCRSPHEAARCLRAVTSTMPRAMDTARAMQLSPEPSSQLNPMDTGIFAGVPLATLKSAAPEEYERWVSAPDRADARFTGGESLRDVAARLAPLFVELERSRRAMVVVGHISSLQVLLAAFRGCSLEEATNIEFVDNTVIELLPSNYGWQESHVTLERASPSSSSSRSSSSTLRVRREVKSGPVAHYSADNATSQQPSSAAS